MLQLWFSLFVLGIVFYPLTSCIFKNFHDKGWIFSKIIGLCVTGLFMWLLSYLKIMEYSTSNCYVIIFIFAILNAILAFRTFKKEKFTWKNFNFSLLKNIIIMEVIFLACFGFWCYIKGFNPYITNTTEQYMDYGYLNSIMNAKHMPPEDIWLSGNTINYYYFGQYLSGFACKISHLTASEGYNFMIALIATCASVFSASIGYNLFRHQWEHKKKAFQITIPIVVAIFIGVAVSLGGTLHYPIYRWFHPNKANYTYIDETRYIGYKPETNDKAVTEVPIYSTMAGDLHAHYVDLMFSLTTLALLSQYFLAPDEKKKWKSFRFYANLFLLAVLLGIQKMTNYWDFPIYLVIIGITIITKELICGKLNFKSIGTTLLQLAGIVLLEELLTLPFTLDLVINGSVVAFTGITSPFYKLVILWGLPTLCTFIFAICFLLQWKTQKQKFKGFLNKHLADVFVILLACCAIGLVIIPEIVYVKDIYGDEFKRFNTMFKLTYQAYLLFCICTNFMLVKLCLHKTKLVAIPAVILLAINITTFGYGIDALLTIYHQIPHCEITSYSTEKYVKATMAEDYAAIEWIRENIERDKIIVEACELGNSYTTQARISTFTGNPTVLGWVYHEWIWRSNEDYSMPDELNTRNYDVAKLYTATDSITIENIIKKYGIEYIYIGSIEMEKYHPNTFLLSAIGEVVYHKGSAYFIKVDPNKSSTRLVETHSLIQNQ